MWGFYKEYCQDDETDEILKEHAANLKGFPNPIPEKVNEKSAKVITEDLENFDMYLANIDLENDLLNSPLKAELKKHFTGWEEGEIIEAMQDRKASFMYDFIKKNKDSFPKLKDDALMKPLNACVAIIEKMQHEAD